MAKSRASGAKASGLDISGLTFKSIPQSTKSKVETSTKIRQALRNGQTLFLRNDDTGNAESYKLNKKDMTFTVTNKNGSKTVSYEDGGNSWASWLISKNRSYSLK